MPVPDFETIMLPLLVHLSDGADHGSQETLDDLAREFKLSESDRRQLLPSGKQGLFRNRVAWAKFYLKKAGLVDNPRRGVYRITDLGRSFVQRGGSVNVQSLQAIPAFRDFLLSGRASDSASPVQGQAFSGDGSSAQPSPPLPPPNAKQLTPEELLETGHEQLTAQLSAEVLERVKQASPEFFERLVVDLLLALGYGGSRRDAGQTIGRTGDEGIDGIINEDRLGLDTIYIQAKRWESTVGRPEVQKFAGALQGQRALKGVMITTSSFSKDAFTFASSIGSKIVLMDGDQLARLMIEHNVGVAHIASYEVKRIDSDYFVED